jgi:serine/threonine protein kinase
MDSSETSFLSSQPADPPVSSSSPRSSSTSSFSFETVASKIEKQEPLFVLDHYQSQSLFKETPWTQTYRALETSTQEPVFLRIFKNTVIHIPGALNEWDDALYRLNSWSLPSALLFKPVVRSFSVAYSVAPYPKEYQTLSSLLKKRLSPQNALKVLLHGANALLQLRHCAILHRHLNPSNFLINSNFEVLLDEIEISFILERRLQENRWGQAPDFLEDSQYQSLEMLNGIFQDPRSDIFALGLLFYEMITGEYAFKATSPEQQKLRQMTNTLGDFKMLAPLCPIPLQQLLQRCTAGDLRERFQTLEELLECGSSIQKEWVQPTILERPYKKAPPKPPPFLSLKARWILFFVLSAVLVFSFFPTSLFQKAPSPRSPLLPLLSPLVWKVNEEQRCAGRVVEARVREFQTVIRLKDFEDQIRLLRFEEPEGHSLEIQPGQFLVVSGKVFQEKQELFLKLDRPPVFPFSLLYQEKAALGEWVEVSAPSEKQRFWVEGIVVHCKTSDQGLLVFLGDSENTFSFLIPRVYSEKLPFLLQVGQVLRVEFPQKRIPFVLQEVSQLTPLETWYEGDL